MATKIHIILQKTPISKIFIFSEHGSSPNIQSPHPLKRLNAILWETWASYKKRSQIVERMYLLGGKHVPRYS